MDEQFVKHFSDTCQGDLAPITAAFGGIVAQEVLKACTSKFTPIHQYFYMDNFEALPEHPTPGIPFSFLVIVLRGMPANRLSL